MGDFFKILGLTAFQTDIWVRDGILNIREFTKAQPLADGMQRNRIGVMISGTALLESRVQEEQRRILDYYEKDDVFGGRCLPDMTRGFYYIIAAGRCRVAFFDLDKMLEANLRQEYEQLLGELMEQSTGRMVNHLDILGQRTMRQKLIAFFGNQRRKKGKSTFLIPFPLTDCADYLAVDRSAMMRELGKMKEEKLVTAQGRRIEIF